MLKIVQRKSTDRFVSLSIPGLNKSELYCERNIIMNIIMSGIAWLLAALQQMQFQSIYYLVSRLLSFAENANEDSIQESPVIHDSGLNIWQLTNQSNVSGKYISRVEFGSTFERYISSNLILCLCQCGTLQHYWYSYWVHATVGRPIMAYAVLRVARAVVEQS